LVHTLNQKCLAQHNDSSATSVLTVQRINITSTTNSTSPLRTHNRLTTGKAQRPTCRGNEVMNIPPRGEPRQHTAARVTMAMPPHGSEVIAIGGTIVTQSRVHIRPSIRAVIW